MAARAASWREILHVPHPLFLIGAFAGTGLDAVLGGARLFLFNRVLGREARFMTFVRAHLATIFGMTVTPSGVGGGPTQVYMLHREGVPLGEGILTAVASYLTTLVFLAVAGVVVAAGGTMSSLREHPLLAAVLQTTGLFSVALGAGLGLLAFRPGLLPGLVYRLFQLSRAFRRGGLRRGGQGPSGPTPAFRRALRSVQDARRAAGVYLGKGRAVFLLGTALAAAIFFNKFLQAYLIARALGAMPSFVEVMHIQVPALILAYYSPSPGGSGVAEVTTALMMGNILPHARLPLYVFLWRAAVFYLTAAAGGWALFLTLRRRRDTVRA